MTDRDGNDPLIERLVAGRLTRPGILDVARLQRQGRRALLIRSGLIERLFQRLAHSSSVSGEAMIWPRGVGTYPGATDALTFSPSIPSAAGMAITQGASAGLATSAGDEGTFASHHGAAVIATTPAAAGLERDSALPARELSAVRESFGVGTDAGDVLSAEALVLPHSARHGVRHDLVSNSPASPRDSRGAAQSDVRSRESGTVTFGASVIREMQVVRESQDMPLERRVHGSALPSASPAAAGSSRSVGGLLTSVAERVPESTVTPPSMPLRRPAAERARSAELASHVGSARDVSRSGPVVARQSAAETSHSPPIPPRPTDQGAAMTQATGSFEAFVRRVSSELARQLERESVRRGWRTWR
jgi:hypothetical protein